VGTDYEHAARLRQLLRPAEQLIDPLRVVEQRRGSVAQIERGGGPSSGVQVECDRLAGTPSTRKSSNAPAGTVGLKIELTPDFLVVDSDTPRLA
jgi:hypothetical protein